jgi:hypothetical protein
VGSVDPRVPRASECGCTAPGASNDFPGGFLKEFWKNDFSEFMKLLWKIISPDL